MVKPLSPDRLTTKENYLRSRIDKIERMIKELWPIANDSIPNASSHFEDELDLAIIRLKRRKRLFNKSHPKKNVGDKPNGTNPNIKFFY